MSQCYYPALDRGVVRAAKCEIRALNFKMSHCINLGRGHFSHYNLLAFITKLPSILNRNKFLVSIDSRNSLPPFGAKPFGQTIWRQKICTLPTIFPTMCVNMTFMRCLVLDEFAKLQNDRETPFQ